MAIQAAMIYAVQHVVEAFQKYAGTQGWGPGDYRMFVRASEEWGHIHVILVAKAFPGKSKHDQWLSVLDFIERELKDEPALRAGFHLTLRTFDQVKEGGLYSIGPDFVDVDLFLRYGLTSGEG